MQAILNVAAADKTKALTALAAANTTLEAELVAEATKIDPVLGEVASAFGPEIVAALGSQENAFFTLLVAKVTSIQASLGVTLPPGLASAV